ncbi:hypothetical protein F5884DRAFT_851622 [Xylogone sp. PMI_703]|nr:hypothetical protein F5884DRAFT_851622 [Xylogone sp. PMI_703]
MEALLGFLVGQVNGQPCTHCANGSGVWTECVSVAGYLNGACTNCHYGSEGSRCSFHVPVRNRRAAPTAPAAPAPARAGPSRALRSRAPPVAGPAATGSVAVVLPARLPPRSQPSGRSARPSAGRVRRPLPSSQPVFAAGPATTGRIRHPRVTRQERNSRIADALRGFADILGNAADSARELADLVEWKVVDEEEEEDKDEEEEDNDEISSIYNGPW